MSTKNDITGDVIQSRPSKAYSNNWEKIFAKQNSKTSAEDKKNVGQVAKGRSRKK